MVEPSHIGEGRVGVDVSFVSFLCAKEKSDERRFLFTKEKIEVFSAPKKRMNKELFFMPKKRIPP